MLISTDPINTLENLIAKNKTKSISIYLVIVLAIVVFLVLLPIIKIDISSQSRGLIRSTTDNVPLSSLVNGKVTFIKLKNNQVVHQGDTLVRLTQENLDTEKATNNELAVDWKSLTALQLSYSAMSISLKNIIENAFRHAQSSQKIQIFQKQNCLFIRDFGVGLNQQEVELVTKRFWRKNALQHGYGLGLALSQILLEQQGFLLKFEHSQPHGLTVVIDFNPQTEDVN